MATINFFLRGNEKIKKIYFRFRPNKNFDFVKATPYEIDEVNWDKENQQWNTNQITKGAKTQEKKILNSKIESFNINLDKFKASVTKEIDDNLQLNAPELKEFLTDFVDTHYFAHRIKTEIKNGIPEKFSDLIEYYINFRSVEDKTKGTKPLAQNTVKKYNTLKKVIRDYDKNLLATQIGDIFRNDFVRYLNQKKYSTNTQVKYIKDIKMLCKFANKQHNINKEVLSWEINSTVENVSEYVTFSLEHIKKIKTAEMPTEYLDNARDWLLISIFTSARVSELFTFDENNIIEYNGNQFLSVIEKKNRNTKNGGQKYLYLTPEVLEILNKRGGKFPRKISEQRYNEFIKLVCKHAQINDTVQGGIVENINGIKRKVKTETELWRLVTSHSGRATFVTLFSEYLPMDIIQLQTNHQSKEMVEHYNKTDFQEMSLRKVEIMANAYKEVKLKIV